jgi:acyl carrier protein
MSPILTELNLVFCSVFRRTDLVITPVSDAHSVAGWDSLTHMELISETEKHFGLNFSFNEIMSFRNVGDIIECIEKHRKN